MRLKTKAQQGNNLARHWKTGASLPESFENPIEKSSFQRRSEYAGLVYMNDIVFYTEPLDVEAERKLSAR